jgi:hypothetical protein
MNMGEIVTKIEVPVCEKHRDMIASDRVNNFSMSAKALDT